MSSLNPRKMLPAVLMTVAVTAAAAASIAVAATFGSTVSAAYVPHGPHSWSVDGTVTSEKGKCVKNRDLTLYRMRDEEPDPSADDPVRPGQTDELGAYSIPGRGNPSGNSYYTVAEKKKFGRKGHKKVCAPARSNIVTSEA